MDTDPDADATRAARLSSPASPSPGPGAHPAHEFETRIAEYEDRPDVCTIAPRSIAARDLVTTWLSTDRRHVVDLAAHR